MAAVGPLNSHVHQFEHLDEEVRNSHTYTINKKRQLGIILTPHFLKVTQPLFSFLHFCRKKRLFTHLFEIVYGPSSPRNYT